MIGTAPTAICYSSTVEASTASAIDAATKPLREEIERLKESLERNTAHWVDAEKRAKDYLADFQKSGKDSAQLMRVFKEMIHHQGAAVRRADQAEARNKALVEALDRLDR